MAPSFHVPGSGFEGRTKRRRGSRLSAPLYLALSIALILSERVLPIVPDTIREVSTDIAAPVLSVFRTPITFAQGVLERVAGVSDLYNEYQLLKEENERLRRFRDAALTLGKQNERLRKILNVPGRDTPAVATARIVGVGGGAFEESVIINAGRADGIRRDLPVVTDNQVIGRIISVGWMSSRILMITDLNSRVPVRVERTGALAIASGMNLPQLTLDFLPEETPVRTGDRVLTSGHGGLFPPDLPVAIVVSVEGDDIRLAPLAPLDRMDFVRVIDYASPIVDVAAAERESGDQR